MALFHSPRIVTNGLVLCLDAANTKSYPGTGTTWTDLSSSRNNCTLVNGPTFVSGANAHFVFDGTNDHVTFSTQPPVGNSNLSSTVEIIAFRDSISTFEILFGGGLENTNQSYYYGFNAGASSFITSYYANDQGGNTPTTNVAWNHYVGTYNNSAGSRYRYFNGTLLSPSQDSGVTNTQASTYAIAAFNQGAQLFYYFKGKISVVKIYNRALSAAEVQQNFNATRSRFGI
jgi:hypothetical protein